MDLVYYHCVCAWEEELEQKYLREKDAEIQRVERKWNMLGR